MDQLILCNIPNDLEITRYFEDRFFEEVEPEDLSTRKNEIIEIVGYLKTKGFYSGAELDFSPLILYEILGDQGLVFKQYEKTGYGIDILNLNKMVEDILKSYM